MCLSKTDNHFQSLLTKVLITLKSINGGIQHYLSQGLELVQNGLVLNAQQEGGSGSQSCNSNFDVLVLHALLEDLVEAVLVGVQLLVAEVALSLLLENVHGHLLADAVVRLSPRYENFQKILILVLEGINL